MPMGCIALTLGCRKNRMGCKPPQNGCKQSKMGASTPEMGANALKFAPHGKVHLDFLLKYGRQHISSVHNETEL